MKENEKAAKLKESLVPWKAKVLLAKPGISKNGYEYPEDVLKASTPKWVNRPITTDHSMDCGRLVGVTTSATYENGGLYAEGVGLMDADLANKLSGLPDKGIPALIRGVSMGADGELIDVEGKDLPQIDGNTYEPLEWTFTPFPAMPDAQVVEFAMLKESLNREAKIKKAIEDSKTREFASFDECVDQMLGQGYDEETAKKICATICGESAPKVPLKETSKGIVEKVKDGVEKLIGKQKDEAMPTLIVGKCSKCGAEFDWQLNACPKCGEPFEKAKDPTTKEDKLPENSKPPPTLMLPEIKTTTPTQLEEIEKQVRKLDEKAKTETETKAPEGKPLETVKPTEPTISISEIAKIVKEAVKKEFKEYTQLAAKKLVEVKPKGVSTAVNPPEPPRFDTVQDIVNFVKDLRDAKDEGGRPKYSTRDAWKIACMEVFEQAQNE